MLENRYVFAAAEAVIAVVDQDRNSKLSRKQRGGLYTLEGEVASELYKHLDMTFERALGQAMEQARQEEISLRLGHLDPRDLMGGDWDENKRGQSRIEKLRTLFAQALEELDELENHQCSFGEDDYCVTCGLDGRA